jgi:hypothetical protein
MAMLVGQFEQMLVLDKQQRVHDERPDHVESDGRCIGPDGHQRDNAALVAPGGITVHMTADRCACYHKA